MSIAHRGASAYAPENTVAAFDEAICRGARAVEFDVQLSADGVPVVIHDETLERTTTGRGRVKDHPLLELMRMDAGSWMHQRFAGTRIPTLDEALLAIGPRAMPVIELKAPVPPVELLGHLKRYDLEEACLVISFRAEWLGAVRRESKAVSLGLLSETWDADLPNRAKKLDAEVLILHTDVLGTGVASAVEPLGLELWCYTANDVGMVAACASLGATGIITDRPDLIRTRR